MISIAQVFIKLHCKIPTNYYNRAETWLTVQYIVQTNLQGFYVPASCTEDPGNEGTLLVEKFNDCIPVL